MKYVSTRVLAVCLALAALLVSCPSPLGNAKSGTITLSFSGAPRSQMEAPAVVDPTLAIKTLLVEVNGPGMEKLTSEPVSYDAAGTTLTMSIPAGSDRVVTISARNDAEATLYSQTQTVSIVAGKELQLSFNLDGVTYTVSFNPNGGSGSMDPQSIAYGSSVALTENGFTRAGYDFIGWATTAEGEVSYTDKASYTMGATGSVLYAQWSAHQYSISYDLNYAGSSGTLDFYTINSTVTLMTPTRDGYAFGGWFNDAGSTGAAIATLPAGSTGDKTFYAKWKETPTISVYKPVTVSSTESSYVAQNAVDGNMETRWAGTNPVDPVDGQYIYIDLGQSCTIAMIKLHFEAGSTSYLVQRSDDANTWTNIGTYRNTFENEVTAIITDNLPVSARFIRMIAYDTLGTAGVSLYEFEIYDEIVISGQFIGSVLDSGPKNNGGLPVSSGTAISTAPFTSLEGPSTNSYGYYYVSPEGNWTYTLETENSTAVNNLNVGQSLTDSFNIETAGIPRLVTITIWGADETGYASGQYIQGDGSGGGGGGASSAFLGGAGGAGGGDNDTSLAGTVGNDIVFGDGSGGGKGGRGVGADDVTGTGAGLGGGGADSINGGTGDDIIFGDGFSGTMDQWNSGKGGFGGGGGGGSGGNLGTYLGAIGGLGAGSGSGYAGSVAPLVAGFGNSGGSGTTAGGSSATSITFATGPGGASYGPSNGLGGGGGFGGSSGGAGASGSGPGNVGGDGNTAEFRYNDTGSIHSYVAGRLATILTDYPAYGTGIDTLDGGPGSDELFGLGGADIFVFELDDAFNGNDIDTIWDFNKNSEADQLRLLITGVAIGTSARDAMIAAQITEGTDRKIVFSNQADKQVTIVMKNLGRDIVASDFAQ